MISLLEEVHIPLIKSSYQKVNSESNQSSSSKEQLTTILGTEKQDKHHHHWNVVISRLRNSTALDSKCGTRTGQCWSITLYITGKIRSLLSWI